MQLRDYQQKAVDMTWDYIRSNPGKWPCLELSTGAGKSLIVAELCRQIVQDWNGRVLMLTSVKELVGQNSEEMRAIWPNAPMGVYSAGLGLRQLGEPITFAGIQSVFRRAAEIGHIDVILIDECHQVGHEDDGMYRDLIAALRAINPNLIVIGLTATPFRMGHGLITDEPAIFDDILRPTSIEELIFRKFLAPLKSKRTGLSYDLSKVKRSRSSGDYVDADLQKAVDTDWQNEEVVKEVIALAGDRRSWLFFCTGVDHCFNVRDKLRGYGVDTEAVVGSTPDAERDAIISRFKSGELKALCSVGVLTTGFNAPNTDLIAMLRPTLSVNLYIQMAGRGLRLKDHTDHCLFLDFAGVVDRHGPITSPITPERAGKGGKAPVKGCPECKEQVATATRVCPDCGYEWPEPEAKAYELRDDDIMGNEPNVMRVTNWSWSVHEKGDKKMLRVDYYGGLAQEPLTEYICIEHGGWGQKRAEKTMQDIARCGGWAEPPPYVPIEECAEMMNKRQPPSQVEYKPDGKFKRIDIRMWPTLAEEDGDDLPF